MFHFWEVCAGLTRLAVIKSTFPRARSVKWAWDGATLPRGCARSQDLEQEEAPVPTKSSHHHSTYWNKRVTQPTPRGISCKREEKSWIWLLCQAPQAPPARAPHSPHSPAWLQHLEAPVAQRDLARRQRLPRAHLHGLESWGAGRHGGDRASGVGEDRHWCLSTSEAWIAQGKGTGMPKCGCHSPGGWGQEQEQLKEGRVFPAMQKSEQEALEELRGVLAVVTFGTCVQSLNHWLFGACKMSGLTQSGLLQWLKHQNPF